jgi:glycolate oxidase FAD binding subunit
MPINAPPTTLAVDGLTPSSVVEPSSIEELTAALADANERGIAVIPWGAGRHMSLGNVPNRYDIALRTTKLDRVIEHEPADMTVTVEAGITMAKLQATLAEHGQFLPIDAPADSTVGGVLAAGVSGPSRHAYGLPRDWLIGCRTALADGTLIKGGGRVVKNVAGYDMPKLAVGSLGTLSVIVEATFKLAPLPVAQETLVATFDSPAAATMAAFEANERGLALRAVAVRDDGTAAFWLAGPAAAVERSKRELAELTHDVKTERLEGPASEQWWAEDTQAGAPTLALRASLLPSHGVALLDRLSSARAESVAYPTTGLVVTHMDESDVDHAVQLVNDLRAWVESTGGSLVVTLAPVEIKQRIDVWGDAGSALPVMRRLKEQFDPRATLNPGRFVGGL